MYLTEWDYLWRDRVAHFKSLKRVTLTNNHHNLSFKYLKVKHYSENVVYTEARLKKYFGLPSPGSVFSSTPGWLEKSFYNFEIEKIALILIYFNWFSSSLLHSTVCVYFFRNPHATIMNLVYFNPHNPRLAG